VTSNLTKFYFFTNYQISPKKSIQLGRSQLKLQQQRKAILDFFCVFILTAIFILCSQSFLFRISVRDEIAQSTDSNLREEIPQQFQGKIIRKVRLKNPEKVIALTFDDGPVGDTTLQILDILEQYQVKATFFWVGANLQQYPYVGRTIIRQGHAIGNHSWSHSSEEMSDEVAALEIEDTSRLIVDLTGMQTRLFRPPLGYLENGLVTYAQKQNYAIILWSIDSGDGVGYAGVKTIANNVVNNAHSGGIVLLHDAPWYRQKTVEALPQIIEGLRSQGYHFVTLPELLAMGE